MLCDKCGTNEAVVHRIMVINGKKTEQHLCGECAKKSGTLSFKLPSFADLTSVSFKAKEPGTACQCGMTLESFKEGGLFGCPKCYDTFGDAMLNIVKSSQGGRSQHLGAKPSSGVPAVESQLSSLRRELTDAIEKEEYERAAELRDRIRSISTEGKQHEDK